MLSTSELAVALSNALGIALTAQDLGDMDSTFDRLKQSRWHVPPLEKSPREELDMALLLRVLGRAPEGRLIILTDDTLLSSCGAVQLAAEDLPRFMDEHPGSWGFDVLLWGVDEGFVFLFHHEAFFTCCTSQHG